jgi:hypothetical protein
MPLSINVGLSRKASQNYQSTGVSINVTAELDSALLAKPAELQQQIESLYGQAEAAIDRQVQAYAGENAPQAQQPTNGNTLHRNGTSRASGRDQHLNGSGSRHTTSMTESQRRAIHAIADRAGLNAAEEANDLFGVTLDELTLKMASELIDQLKASAPARNNGNVRR